MFRSTRGVASISPSLRNGATGKTARWRPTARGRRRERVMCRGRCRVAKRGPNSKLDSSRSTDGLLGAYARQHGPPALSVRKRAKDGQCFTATRIGSLASIPSLSRENASSNRSRAAAAPAVRIVCSVGESTECLVDFRSVSGVAPQSQRRGNLSSHPGMPS